MNNQTATLPGIFEQEVYTSRIRTHVLSSGPVSGTPVIFIHGNASSATFWEEVMLKLPARYNAVALDLRGFGSTDDKVIDATRGFGEWVDDVHALMDTLGISKAHVVGHSLGGGVVWGLVAAAPERLLSATLVACVSPFGFGGTKDASGTPCATDFAGSGGGVVSPEFARLLGEGDRGAGPSSPRTVMNSYYFKPPFVAGREEALLSSVLTQKVGPQRYPGDSVASTNWPNVGPGRFGPINAMSPKYVAGMAEKVIGASPKPPILWVHGTHDQVVGDNSLFDMGTLGMLGAVPGWPGHDVCPPQPMETQIRSVLAQYVAGGGRSTECALADTGHTPFIEKPDEFMAALVRQLDGEI